jgi:hypothetical protein
MLRILSVIATAILIGCGGSSTSPTSTVAGNWSGTISSNVVGNGTLTMTLLQSGTALSGTWSTTYANSSNNNSGSLAGSVNGAQLGATLTPSVPSTCPYNAAGTLSGTTISGTYAAFNCTVAASGTFTITKQ